MSDKQPDHYVTEHASIYDKIALAGVLEQHPTLLNEVIETSLDSAEKVEVNGEEWTLVERSFQTQLVGIMSDYDQMEDVLPYGRLAVSEKFMKIEYDTQMRVIAGWRNDINAIEKEIDARKAEE